MRSPFTVLTGSSLRASRPALVRELKSLGLLLFAIFAFRWTIAEPYQVPTGSMEPTIQPGDRLLVLKAAYELDVPFTHFHLFRIGEPERGEIIVFRNPSDPSIDLVKRLIGLPGDHVEIVDGVISINGKPVPDTEPGELRGGAGGASASSEGLSHLYEESLGKTRYQVQRLPHTPSTVVQRFDVPEDRYFFMGDNRDNSNDSRFWGFAPGENLKGRALLVWLSLEPWHGGIPHFRWGRVGTRL